MAYTRLNYPSPSGGRIVDIARTRAPVIRGGVRMLVSFTKGLRLAPPEPPGAPRIDDRDAGKGMTSPLTPRQSVDSFGVPITEYPTAPVASDYAPPVPSEWRVPTPTMSADEFRWWQHYWAKFGRRWPS